jgi:hypothetical protein
MAPVTDLIQILHGEINLLQYQPCPGLVEPSVTRSCRALGPAGRGETVPDHE